MTLSRLAVAPDGTHFVRDGRPFPLVLDTAWAAFAIPSLPEWRHYLAVRRQQGFTGIMVTILPVLHDRTVTPGARAPFAVDADGHYDFDRPDAGYFELAGEFVRVAAAEGLVAGLVVLWNGYLPDTWGAAITPWAVMTPEQRTAYVSLVARTFGPQEPILIVSGDDHFRQPAAVAGYTAALAQLAREAPASLTTMHLSPVSRLPPHIADSPDLDFYSYQSGHHHALQHLCHELGALYRGQPVRRPIVNIEPAYEQHGRVEGAGRFSAADVRTAMWWSILGGATAGIGYGAHGMWSWHRPGGVFLCDETSSHPPDWQTALAFRGARDVSLLRTLWEQHSLYALEPAQHLLLAGPAGTRVARRTDGLVAVYAQYAGDIRLDLAATGGTAAGWDLDLRTPVVARVRTDDGLLIEQVDACGDLVFFLEPAAP